MKKIIKSLSALTVDDIEHELRDERDKAITTRKNEELYTVFRKGSVISFSLEHNFEVCDGVSF